MLWGILSVQNFSWPFLAAGQLGVIAHCADEVVQIDKSRRELREQRERERERERREREREREREIYIYIYRERERENI